jgi:hypothetical protein
MSDERTRSDPGYFALKDALKIANQQIEELQAELAAAAEIYCAGCRDGGVPALRDWQKRAVPVVQDAAHECAQKLRQYGGHKHLQAKWRGRREEYEALIAEAGGDDENS